MGSRSLLALYATLLAQTTRLNTDSGPIAGVSGRDFVNQSDFIRRLIHTPGAAALLWTAVRLSLGVFCSSLDTNKSVHIADSAADKEVLKSWEAALDAVSDLSFYVEGLCVEAKPGGADMKKAKKKLKSEDCNRLIGILSSAAFVSNFRNEYFEPT